MTRLDRVLSDDDLAQIIHDVAWPNDEIMSFAMVVAIGVQQAVHAKLAEQQEPVAWRVHPFDYGVGVEGAYAITQQEDLKDVWERKSWEVTPLYAHPMPCVSLTSDKTACVSEIAESDIQRHLDYIKRYQNWRRGEDKTMSEAGITPKQLGESLDWLIAFAENHIADASKMVADMFWDADNPEYLEGSIHNILVNCDADKGDEVEIQRAKRLSNITIKVTGYDEDENEYQWEVTSPSGLDHIPDIGQMILDGWQLVPIEPTEEMLGATSWPNSAGTDYSHMLAAAPKYTGENT